MDKNYYLNIDDNDILEWEDAVPFNPTNIHYYYDSPQPKLWKNALWTVRWKVDLNEMRGYVAINDCEKLPNNWFLRFKYSFALCPVPEYSDTVQIKWTETLNHSFSKPQQDYQDHSEISLPHANFILNNSNHYVTDDGNIILRCKLEAIPVPFSIYQGYNSRRATGMVGLDNLGATCYLNALLQMLYHVNLFRKGVYDIPFKNEEVQQSTTLALQSVFNKLQTDERSVSTIDLTRAFGWNTYEAFQQQDVQEMMRILLDKLEERMKDTPADGVIQKLFVGRIKSYIRCINVDYESSREEDFYDLQLDVRGCRNIYQSFEKYVEKEILNNDNQYDAGEKHGKQDAEKGVQFSKLPPVLTIHLKRFEFDMQRMGFAKIHDRYEFPLRLDLNKFVTLSTDPDNEYEQDTQDAQETDLKGNKLKNIYHLHSVLVHSGDVSGGHYIAFIRPSTDDFWSTISTQKLDDETIIKQASRGGKWYKFDDDLVTLADRREAVEMCYGSGHVRGTMARIGDYSSAYMLVYLRETEASEIMQVVDIPTMLSSRLNDEKMKKISDDLLQKHQTHFFKVDYFLEEDVAQFSHYSEFEDLISEKKSMKQLKLLDGCTYLGLIYQFADILQRLPCEIEVWKAARKHDNKLRVVDCISPKDYSYSVSNNYSYFIRIVEENDPEILQETYNILQLQSKFIEIIHAKYLLSLPHLKLQYNPCEGCGIGCGGYILQNYMTAIKYENLRNKNNQNIHTHHNIIDLDDINNNNDNNNDENNANTNNNNSNNSSSNNNDSNNNELSNFDYVEELNYYYGTSNQSDISKQKLVQIFNCLFERAQLILSKSKSAVEENSTLVFYRAYDLENFWKQLGIESYSDNQKKKKLKSSSNGEYSSDNNSDDDNNNNDDDDSDYDNNNNDDDDSIPNKKTRRIIYLGSSVLNSSTEYRTIHNEFSHLLQIYFQKYSVPFPDKWNLFQFVNISTSSEVNQFEFQPDALLKDLDIDCGNILYCIPIQLSDLDENLINYDDERLVNEAFNENKYISDISEYFENETLKVKVTLRIHRYFEFMETLNRSVGLWKYSNRPVGFPQMTSNGEEMQLSKIRRCCDVYTDIENFFHFSNENRLVVGKTILQSNGAQGYRQLRNQINDKRLIDFFTVNAKTVKYFLHLVLLPFPIDDIVLRHFRLLSFTLCDNRLELTRRKWLEQTIYPQASELYQNQIQELLEENPDLTIQSINRTHLFPIYQSLVWPDNIIPVPDEWVFEDKIFLKFSSEENITISDILEQVKLNIDVNYVQNHNSENNNNNNNSNNNSNNNNSNKRNITYVVSDEENSFHEDNNDNTNDLQSSSAEERIRISRKRSRDDIYPTKQFISRGEFRTSPFDNLQNIGDIDNSDEKNDNDIGDDENISNMNNRINNNKLNNNKNNDEDEDDFHLQNPFLFDESPWANQVYLSEFIQLGGTEKNDWGGPYFMLYEIIDKKTSQIIGPRTPFSQFPKSWIEYFIEDRPQIEPTTIGVQSFSSEEWSFISGFAYNRYKIRSIPLSVFSFELNNMGIAQSASNDFKPFFTYLREDDTIETLSNRIIKIAGENTWESIALISRQYRAHELPIETPSPTIQIGPTQQQHQHQQQQQNSNPDIDMEFDLQKDPLLKEEDNNSQNSFPLDIITQELEESSENNSPSTPSLIWKLYEKYYPDYTSGSSLGKSIPYLGLQRLSTQIINKNENSAKFRKPSGIKIRG